MNSQRQHSTRSSLWPIPLICSFTVINCLGIAIADTDTGNIAGNEVKSPLISEATSEARAGLVGYLPDTAYLLEFFIRALSNILADPTLEKFTLEGADTSLKENADLLIFGYPLFGLDSSLTKSEIEIGLDDAYIILDILNNEPELVGMDEDTQFELIATAESIIEELENGE